MAIYHLSAGVVSRSSGRSAVQSGAYITGECLVETRRELVADYRNRASSVLFHATLFPKGTPVHLQNLDIWDKLESFEDHYAKTHYKSPATQAHYMSTAQTAQTLEVALPKELSPAQWQALITTFAQERFVSRGLIVTLAIHNDRGNPHAHFQISRRSINENGDFSWAKDRDIMSKAALLQTREEWAEYSNLTLEQAGLGIRIDHRSYLEQGIAFTPTQHEGWFAHKLDSMGLCSRIMEENKAIRAENQTLAALEPACIVDELCARQATFSSSQLSALVQSRVNDDATLHSIVVEQSLNLAIPVGVGLDGLTRYSSPDYVAKEQEALNWVSAFAKQASSLAIHPTLMEQAIANSPVNLNAEQLEALHTLCAPVQLGALIGRAGTGKTTALQPVVGCHEQAGYKTIGLCLSASAAENLGTDAKVEAETIAFYLDKWERLEQAKADYAACGALDFAEKTELVKEISFLKPYALSNRHCVIVDEAGMVGTLQWHAILRYAKEAQAKIIAVGDDHQFKAIDAGDFYRAFKEISEQTGTLCTLKTIQRQHEKWMQEASQDLAELKTQEALAAYENRGLVEKVPSGIAGTQAIAARYVDQKLENADKTSSLMAYTKTDCKALNTEVRALLQSKGLVESQDHLINYQNFAVNDSIVFLKNDRKHLIESFNPNTGSPKKFLVKNGTQGRILSIERRIELEPDNQSPEARTVERKPKISHQLTVAINANTHATFNTDAYQEFSHAYAITLHKSQGRTVDWSMVFASKYMDAYALYVAMTRHRESTTLFYDSNTFPNFKALQSNLARLGSKDLAIDYSIHPAQQSAWNNVQMYKSLGQDLSLSAKDKHWDSYNALKIERQNLGKAILENWEAHHHFARQANLSFEAIAIQSGLKMRPLSLAEQEAQKTVALYAEKALQTRTLWKEINQSCPGHRCTEHAEYRAFTELRQERNTLAKTISEYPAIHREFVQHLGKTQGIGWKTLAAQAAQEINFALYDKAAAKTRSNQPLNPLFEQAYAQYTADVQASKVAHGQSPHHPKPFTPRDPRQIRSALERNIEHLALDLLGEPQRKTAKEWRYGSQGAISIAVAGTKQGAYANFADGSLGGPLKLIQDTKGLDFKEAFKWGIAWLGPEKIAQQNPAPQKAALQPDPWTPIKPVGSAPLPQDLSQEPALKYQFTREQRHEVARYAYRDAQGSLLGYMLRFEDAEGKKVVLPLAYCQNAEGEAQWRWKGFLNGADRSLYGLEKLAKYPDKPVLIVEGEKTADKAQKRLPEYVVVSWSGGTGATHKTDFSPLVGRVINLWPDNDEPGLRAMERIGEQLKALHQDQNLPLCLNTVAPAQDWPLKWDLGDRLPKGWALQDLKALLQSKPEIKIDFKAPEMAAKALTDPESTRDTLLAQQTHLGALGQPEAAPGLTPIQPHPTHRREAAITQCLARYGLQAFPCPTESLQHIETRYTQMMQWQALLGIKPSVERQEALFEKAVLTQALLPLTQQTFCVLSSPLQAQSRAESLALISAKLLQEHGTQYNTTDYLKGAKAIFDEQQAQKIEVFKNYQNLHPLCSDRALDLLVDQSLLCRNHCNQLLNEQARGLLLEATHHFESLEKQGQVQKTVENLLHNQSPGVNKESHVTIQKALEQKFMQEITREIQAIRAGKHLEITDLSTTQRQSPSAHLEQAARLTRESHQTIAKQEQALNQEIQKTRALPKDQDRERER